MGRLSRSDFFFFKKFINADGDPGLGGGGVGVGVERFSNGLYLWLSMKNNVGQVLVNLP